MGLLSNNNIKSLSSDDIRTQVAIEIAKEHLHDAEAQVIDAIGTLMIYHCFADDNDVNQFSLNQLFDDMRVRGVLPPEKVMLDRAHQQLCDEVDKRLRPFEI